MLSENPMLEEYLFAKLFECNLKLLKLASHKKPPRLPEAVYT
ncbi:hypothetical protein AGROH133_06925 [Agrobacterium tumefaciens]|nr:hypothetical protein AGROH133_06925 [Agrobacterium tumefaciens]